VNTNEHQRYRVAPPSLAFVGVHWRSLTFALATIAASAHAQAPPPGGTAPKPAEQAATTVQMQATPPPETASRVHFTGNRSFSEKDLRDAVADPLQQIRNEGLSLPLADDTAYYVGVFYRRHGYPVVDVKYKIVNNGRDLDLNITEGPYYNLGNIYFKGNTTFASEVLNDYMVGTTRARVSQFQKNLPYVEADLVTGTSLVQGYYISQGFPKVQIVKLETHPDEARGAVDATVTIIEGPRYYFGPITFKNDPAIPMAEFQPKISALSDRPAPYSEAELNNLQRDLTFIYKTAGHYSAVVTVEPDFTRIGKGGRVPIYVHSTPGPTYRFGKIVVEQKPKARLKPDFLPNRFAELQGQIYNPKSLQTLNTAMVQTGLFDTLGIQEIAEPDDTITLAITPWEAKAKEFSVFGGYRTFDGLIFGAGYTNRNILGEGQIFSVSAEYTSRGPDGKISYEDPWFLNTKYRFRVVLGIEDKTVQGYSYANTYGQVSITRKYATHFETGVFGEFKSVSLSNVTIDPRTLVGPVTYQIGTIGITQSIDYRDSPLNPHHGWILALAGSVSEPFQNASSYLQFTERFSYYHSIGNSLLAFGVRFGFIAPSSGGTLGVPIQERLFNGGDDTVRSFYERELGFRDRNNNPIGGLTRSIFNVEYDFPIIAGLVGAAFFDAGGLGTSPFSSFSTGVGAGLRYNLPVGPLRVDYGVNPSPRANEDFGAFHLSFGFAF
jgi:outer membrane protein insertion porin family